MSQTNPPPGPIPPIKIPVIEPVAIGAQVGCLTLVIVIFSIFAGITLDRVLGTRPVLTILLVLGSAPIALTLTYFVAMRSIRQMKKPAGPASGNGNSGKEEE
jgi:MFS family permease